MLPVFIKSAIRSSAICAAFALSCGCTVQTIHPLHESGYVVRDDRILGDWQQFSPEFGECDLYVSISLDDSGGYQVREINDDHPFDHTGYLVQMGDRSYIELRESSTLNNSRPSLSTRVDAYLFARIQIEENEITVTYPNQYAIKKAISSGELTGIVDHQTFPARVILTSTADKLREFLDANPESAFSEPLKWRRAKLEDRDAK